MKQHINYTVFVLIFISFQTNCLGENMDETMSFMDGDIMGIAPSLIQSDMGSSNKAHWPKNRIPYEFEKGYPKALKEIFRQAVKHISARTCFRLVPRKNEKDYVHVHQGTGCSSFVGRMGGRQLISLPAQCKKFGTFVHEILHAIGFQHEQARFDRDKYVTIHLKNVEPERYHNFERNSMQLRSKYDYNSVMHYSKDAFSKNGKATIVPLARGVSIGQREGMSTGDIDEINKKFCS